ALLGPSSRGWVGQGGGDPMEDFRCGALLRVASAVALAVMLCFPATAAAVDYDIVYVRQPRYGDHTNTIWPEVFHPARIDPGADLMLLHPDGSEELLVEGGNGSVTDPFVSFDAQWVYYAYFHDARPDP